MSEPTAGVATEVPTFSECVVGYRAWGIDKQGRLWPLSDRRRPWEPGINIARCNCRGHGALSFDWSWRDGRRVLEPRPEHQAPDADCTCGLYSWRRPSSHWAHDQRLVSARQVCGAVASWGRLQVHGPGFRAEHACVVTLAYPPGTGAEAMRKLERVAARYGVELVPLDHVEEAASRHGSPLPDSLGADTEADLAPANTTAVSAQRRELDHNPASAVRHAAPVPPAELEPMSARDRAAIALLILSLLVISCGGIMWHGRGSVSETGAALVLGGAIALAATMWKLEPHKAAKRGRRRARSRREHRKRLEHQRSQPTMTEEEFDAIEDALEPLYKHGNKLDNGLDPYGRM